MCTWQLWIEFRRRSRDQFQVVPKKSNVVFVQYPTQTRKVATSTWRSCALVVICARFNWRTGSGFVVISCRGRIGDQRLLLPISCPKSCLDFRHGMFSRTRPGCARFSIRNPLRGLLGTPWIHSFASLRRSDGRRHSCALSSRHCRNAIACTVDLFLPGYSESWFPGRYD